MSLERARHLLAQHDETVRNYDVFVSAPRRPPRRPRDLEAAEADMRARCARLLVEAQLEVAVAQREAATPPNLTTAELSVVAGWLELAVGDRGADALNFSVSDVYALDLAKRIKERLGEPLDPLEREAYASAEHERPSKLRGGRPGEARGA